LKNGASFRTEINYQKELDPCRKNILNARYIIHSTAKNIITRSSAHLPEKITSALKRKNRNRKPNKNDTLPGSNASGNEPFFPEHDFKKQFSRFPLAFARSTPASSSMHGHYD